MHAVALYRPLAFLDPLNIDLTSAPTLTVLLVTVISPLAVTVLPKLAGRFVPSSNKLFDEGADLRKDLRERIKVLEDKIDVQADRHREEREGWHKAEDKLQGRLAQALAENARLKTLLELDPDKTLPESIPIPWTTEATPTTAMRQGPSSKNPKE